MDDTHTHSRSTSLKTTLVIVLLGTLGLAFAMQRYNTDVQEGQHQDEMNSALSLFLKERQERNAVEAELAEERRKRDAVEAELEQVRLRLEEAADPPPRADGEVAIQD